MKVSKYLALLLLVGIVAVGCWAAPEESGPDAAAPESAAADAGSTEAAGAETATAAAEQPQRRERPQPNAPRAEGEQLAAYLADNDVLLLDVRRPEELEANGTVEGYLNIPIEELADRLSEVPRDKPILTA